MRRLRTYGKHDRMMALVHRLANVVSRESLLEDGQVMTIEMGPEKLSVSYKPGMKIGVHKRHQPQHEPLTKEK